MKAAPAFTIVIALTFLLITAGLTGQAQATGNGQYSALVTEPGNQCIACHSVDDPRLAQPYRWQGSIDAQAISPCPAASSIQEEIYSTDRLFLAIDRLQASLPTWIDTSKVSRQVQNYSQNYARLLETPVSSKEAFSSEALLLRYKLGKAYFQLSSLNDQARQTRTFFFASLVTLIVILSLFWGLYNTRRLSGGTVGQRSLPAWGILALALIFVLFALPIFRTPAASSTAATDVELERLAAIDGAQRSAGASERAESRVWALSRAAYQLVKLDPDLAQQATQAAVSAAKENRMNSLALWGESHAASDLSTGNIYALDQASVAVDALNASRSRAWGLSQAASDWSVSDPEIAAAFLEQALLATRDSLSPYRDLDLRLIAVAWANLDSERSLDILHKIADPAIRSWGYREIAQISADPGLYGLAADSARQVSDPIQLSRLLGEIGSDSGNPGFYKEALHVLENAASLQNTPAASLAYGYAALATIAQDATLVNHIEENFADARALAYFGSGDYQAAWIEAGKINDPYEKAHAQAAIATAWQNLDKCAEIGIPLLRDKALSDIMISSRDATRIDQIQSIYYQVEVLTSVGQYNAAWHLAGTDDGLYDKYPLRLLGIKMAASDPDMAESILESMDREIDKASVLTALAASSQSDQQPGPEEETFQRALSMALAARVSGDALAPFQASLNLAETCQAAGRTDQTLAALKQAAEIADRIAIK